jgi:RNA recognition motif-containing protein
MTIFVANVDKQTEEGDLQALFTHYGTVMNVHIFRDRKTEESLGYAFVEMPDDFNAERAIRNLDGHFWNDRQLKVSERRPGYRDED